MNRKAWGNALSLFYYLLKKRLKKIFLFQIKGRYLNHDSNEAISKQFTK
jgi:hypothetical protein